MKIKLLIFFFFVITSKTFSQNPPSMAMPAGDKEVLIEKLIEVCDYEAFLKTYCYKKIDKNAQQNNWNAEYVKKLKESVQLKYFKSTISNTLSFYSTEELNDLVEIYNKINNRKKNNKQLIINNIILSNLENFSESILLGKYIL
ncbi:MAG: hypothetical protein ACOVNP_07140 [Flavobacterium sp.]